MDKRAIRALSIVALLLGAVLVFDMTRSSEDKDRVNRRVLRLERGRVQAIAWPELRVARGHDGEFRGPSGPARKDTIDAFFGALEMLSAARTREGTVEDGTQLRLELDDGSTRVLTLGSTRRRMAWIALDSDKKRYLVESHLVRELQPAPDSVVVNQVLEFQRDAVTGLELNTSEQSLVFRNAPPMVRLPREDSWAEVPSTEYSLLLDALSDIELADGAAPPAKDTSRLSISVIAEAGRVELDVTDRCGDNYSTHGRLGDRCATAGSIERVLSLVERPLLDWVKRAPVDESALSAVRATRGTRSLSIGLRNGQVIATDEGGEEVIDERSVRRWIEAINASASPPVLAKPEGPALAQLGLEYATGASTTLYMHRMPFGMALFRDREGIAYPLVPGGAEKVVPSASYFAGRVLVDRDLYAIHRIETEIKQQLYRIERGVVVGDWLSTQTRVDPSWPGELARELSYLQGLETERRPKQAPARKLVLHFEEPPIPDPKAATRIELELYGNSSRCSAGKRGASDVWRLNAKTCAILLGDWSSPRP